MLKMQVMMLIVLPLDLPPEMQKLVGGARQPERPGGVVAVHLVSQVKKLVKERVIKIRYRNHEFRGSAFFFEPYFHRHPPFLYLRLFFEQHLEKYRVKFYGDLGIIICVRRREVRSL